ncbi:unnamed protein product [Victoria cruziana]
MTGPKAPKSFDACFSSVRRSVFRHNAKEWVILSQIVRPHRSHYISLIQDGGSQFVLYKVDPQRARTLSEDHYRSTEWK